MVRRVVPALFACLLVVSTSVACGGDDDSDDGAPNPGNSPTQEPGDQQTPTRTPKPSNPDPESEPSLAEPASQFSLFHADLGAGYLTDLDVTFEIDLPSYAQVRIFESPEQGERLLNEWGYIGGYETGYIPEGREQTVLLGGFYMNIETHLFESPDGAHEFYVYVNSRLKLGSAEIEALELGNESTAWVREGEAIGTSEVRSVLYWYVFRRGNMVATVRTYGALGLLRVEPAEVLASIIDDKALGKRDRTAPTPMAGGQ